MHNSSQFDQGNMSTTAGDGSQLQQNHFSVSTDVDPLEQKHNSMNLALGKPTQSFRQSKMKNYHREGAHNSLQGTTADSFALHQSSNRGEIQKWRPGASSALKEESLLSSVSQPLDRSITQQKPANVYQNRSVIGNHNGSKQPNLTGAASHPENTTVNVDDSLISAEGIGKSVEQKD